MGTCGRNIQRIKNRGGKVIEQVSDSIDLGNMISELKEDIFIKL
jgi:hypothetical protein